MYCEQKTNAEEDLKHCIEKLFDLGLQDENIADSKPKILWSFYFSVPDTSNVDLRQTVPKNVFLCSGPDLDLDYDLSIQKVLYYVVIICVYIYKLSLTGKNNI